MALSGAASTVATGRRKTEPDRGGEVPAAGSLLESVWEPSGW